MCVGVRGWVWWWWVAGWGAWGGRVAAKPSEGLYGSERRRSCPWCLAGPTSRVTLAGAAQRWIKCSPTGRPPHHLQAKDGPVALLGPPPPPPPCRHATARDHAVHLAGRQVAVQQALVGGARHLHCRQGSSGWGVGGWG